MHVLNLAVHSAFRRQVVATLLLQRSMTLARKHGIKLVCLEVRPSNHLAIEIYSKMGFCKKGRKTRYYSETQEDAIVMAKDITTQSIMEGL
jgi:ribosomal-protein-alanine N-acetyltransferase